MQDEFLVEQGVHKKTPDPSYYKPKYFTKAPENDNGQITYKIKKSEDGRNYWSDRIKGEW